MTDKFELVSPFKPTGDQPAAIEKLVKGLNENKRAQVLLGATGTGKTFTVSHVIAQVNKPTLVFVHNKTLAGQLYSEFKELFPNNRVEYFVSNFDYYQPEAYIPKSDTYIEKTAMINEELDMLRMSSLNAVLERRDTIVVASVACIYASSDPNLYRELFFSLHQNETIDRKDLIRKLVERQYARNDMELKRGTFRVVGDSIEVSLGYTDQFNLRIELFDNIVERITEVDRVSGKILNAYSVYNIFPANEYTRSKEQMRIACDKIERELHQRLNELESENKLVEKQRLEQRTLYDLEALRELGMCSGIENYSMHIDGRQPGQRPFNLLDYFPKDYLLVIDESHVSIPQSRGMFNGDRARKETLVKYGFRLPSALENRPMRFDEFEKVINQVIYVSATPGDYELEQVNHEVVQQIIRPTGLLDPKITIRPSQGQIDDIIHEINVRIARNERTLITTLTVKMAEELTAYLKRIDLKVVFLHHEVLTFERIEILRDLRRGKYDVLVGINLLREGLDLPEVSLVCILDADKEGFLRSHRSLIQTIGRAARNSNGEVILYADKMTDSMTKAIEETNRRRDIQIAYNIEHNITPTTIIKEIHDVIRGKETQKMAKEYLTKRQKFDRKAQEELILSLEKEMHEAARVLDFERAAELRDIVLELKSS
ncbi:MAG TPA: excinuclease ABC subunit UvrB [Erysipelotrichaceae bacterium]|nr:excinuclease ABC subunit UvrB [Erysipelotrichaceae bacterium]